MLYALLILLLFLAIFWLHKKRNHKRKSVGSSIKNDVRKEPVAGVKDIGVQLYKDENGRHYYENHYVEQIPRRTYVYGVLESKYYGDVHPSTVLFSSRQGFYKIELYDTVLHVCTDLNCKVEHVNSFCKGVHTQLEGKFDLGPNVITSQDWLPYEMRCNMVSSFGRHYQVCILEPEICNIEIDPLLHQQDGNEVFGTLKAKVSGYILDFIEEGRIEKVFIDAKGDFLTSEFEKSTEEEIYQTNTPTGNIEEKSNYVRREYFMSDFKTRYWGEWMFEGTRKDRSNLNGCLGILPLLFLLVLLFPLILYLPQLLFFLPLFALPYLLSLIPAKAWTWILGLFGLLIFGMVIFNIYQSLDGRSKRYLREKEFVSPKEEKVRIVDDRGHKREYRDNSWQNEHRVGNDSIGENLICFHREWEDSQGLQYKGDYCLKMDHVSICNSFHNQLISQKSGTDMYNDIYKELFENDQLYLEGIYEMLKQIGQEKKLNREAMANMIVSFVQDFEYALVLDGPCNSNYYQDDFIKDYLESDGASCFENVKFGLYSPVEFLFHRKGDCDSRTLLLYTIFDHFDYDVILLTSFYYRHSILGVGVNGGGSSVQWMGERYLLWETTVPSLPAGIIAEEMLDYNQWQVSLSNNQ